jgi:hypothetical protein
MIETSNSVRLRSTTHIQKQEFGRLPVTGIRPDAHPQRRLSLSLAVKGSRSFAIFSPPKE